MSEFPPDPQANPQPDSRADRLADRPADPKADARSGVAWAAILAAAVGCFVFGLTVLSAEAFPAVSRALNFYNPTGDLSGKSIVAVAAWLLCWATLHARWKHRTIASPRAMLTISLLLTLLSILATFPPFFAMFSRK